MKHYVMSIMLLSWNPGFLNVYFFISKHVGGFLVIFFVMSVNTPRNTSVGEQDEPITLGSEGSACHGELWGCENESVIKNLGLPS